MTDTKREIEIKSLNLDHLDVEELEHRLELTAISPNSPTTCTQNSGCYIN